MLPLVEPLVLGSIIDVDERAIALEARGFSSDKPKTFFRTVEDQRWEQILRWVLVIASVLLIVGRILWPFLGRYLGSGA
jgi:energy-coupling factor transport system permease protein